MAAPCGCGRDAWGRDRRDVQRPEVGVGRVGARGPVAARADRGRARPGRRSGRSSTCASRCRRAPPLRRQVVEERARDVIAADYRHTTARGVEGAAAPDPQLHTHVVITGAVREDDRIVAVASRPMFRAARELGAFYRSALAEELRAEGYPIEAGTGKDGEVLRDRAGARGAARGVLIAQPRGRGGGRAVPRQARPRARARRAARPRAREPPRQGAHYSRRPAARLGDDRGRATASGPTRPCADRCSGAAGARALDRGSGRAQADRARGGLRRWSAARGRAGADRGRAAPRAGAATGAGDGRASGVSSRWRAGG